MAGFAYTARDARGQTVRDVVNAGTRKDALRLLAARGLTPVQITEQNGTPAAGPVSSAAPRLRAAVQPGGRDLLPFLQALSELTTSGLSAGEAVRLLALRMKDRRLKTLSVRVWDLLKEGLTLSGAMERLPGVFDPQSVNLVRAAEATGSLNEVLARLIQHRNEQQALRKKLTAALAYPVFVCLVAVGVILFFVFFLLPRLQSLLTSLGGELPFSTRVLVGGAHVLVNYGVVALPLLGLGGLLLWRWHHSEPGRAAIDARLLRLPVVRRWIVDLGVLAFAQTLAVLLENGINTVEALRLTERTTPNRTMRAALRAATDRVIEGDSLSAALGRTGYFPDLVLDRLAVGESTGKLGPCLRDIARHYSARQTERLHYLVNVVANAVLVFAFSFVGFLAYAIVAAVLRVSASFHF